MKDYYKILGIAKNATADEIVRAASTKASQLIANKLINAEDILESEPARIQEILIIPESRKDYDEHLQAITNEDGSLLPFNISTFTKAVYENNILKAKALWRLNDNDDELAEQEALDIALRIAINNGNVSLVEFLIKNGASVTATDFNDNTPAHLTAALILAGKIDDGFKILELLSKKNIDLTVRNTESKSFLDIIDFQFYFIDAIRQNLLSRAKLIYSLGKFCISIDSGVERESGQYLPPALCIAALNAKMHTIQYLQSIGASTSCVDRENKQPIHYAVSLLESAQHKNRSKPYVVINHFISCLGGLSSLDTLQSNNRSLMDELKRLTHKHFIGLVIARNTLEFGRSIHEAKDWFNIDEVLVNLGEEDHEFSHETLLGIAAGRGDIHMVEFLNKTHKASVKPETPNANAPVDAAKRFYQSLEVMDSVKLHERVYEILKFFRKEEVFEEKEFDFSKAQATLRYLVNQRDVKNVRSFCVAAQHVLKINHHENNQTVLDLAIANNDSAMQQELVNKCAKTYYHIILKEKIVKLWNESNNLSKLNSFRHLIRSLKNVELPFQITIRYPHSVVDFVLELAIDLKKAGMTVEDIKFREFSEIFFDTRGSIVLIFNPYASDFNKQTESTVMKDKIKRFQISSGILLPFYTINDNPQAIDSFLPQHTFDNYLMLFKTVLILVARNDMNVIKKINDAFNQFEANLKKEQAYLDRRELGMFSYRNKDYQDDYVSECRLA